MRNSGKAGRLLYIDALRGITMFLVVYYHVIGKCNGGELLIERALHFRMPLFFFISGFVAYKALDFWTLSNTSKRIVDKIKAQVIPTAIFFCLYFYFLEGCNPFKLFSIYGWGRYWFTIVLFEFLLLYYLLNFITKKNERLSIVVLILSAIIMIVLFHTVRKKGSVFGWFTVYGMTRYFVYFISGSFARKYMDKVTSVCDTKWFLPVMALCVAIQLPRFAGIYITPQLITYIMTVYTLPIAGLLFVFGLFVRFRSLFTETSKVTRCLSYVGRRTLDIYLMHYFLIYYVPFFHDKFVAWGVASQNRLPMFLMAMVILLLCLLVSAIIRKNRFLGKLLFAAKYEKTDNKIQIVH